MKFNKDHHILDNLFFYGIVIFIVSIPFSIIINSFTIITLLVIKIIIVYSEKKITIQIGNRTIFYSFIALFALYSLSLFWSNNSQSSFFLLEKRLSFLVFPLIFFVNPTLLSRKRLNRILALFTVVILIGCLYSHFHVILDMIEKDFGINKWNSWWYTSSNLSGILGLHPTYLSIYINFAILICLYFLLSEKRSYALQSILLVSIGYLLVYNLLLSSRLNMILGIIIVGFLSSYYVKKSLKSKSLFAIFIFLLLSSLIYMVGSMPYLSSKFKQSINYFLLDEENNQPVNNSSSGHFNAWKCSVESINLNSFFLGHGLADTQKVLNGCYEEHNYSYNKMNNFNAHNEFLQLFLSLGLLGFSVLCVCLVESFKKRKMFFTLFLLITLVSFISESVLSTQKGIVFIMFFLTLLNSHSNHIEKIIIHE